MQRSSMVSTAASAALVFACGGGSTPAASPASSAPPVSESDGGAEHHGHGDGHGGGHGGGHGAGHGQHADFPSCAVLAKTCHAHDKDSDKAHACHVLGHSAPSNEECEAKRAECLAICGGADGGV